MRVGVVAIQGDFERHLRALKQLEVPHLETAELRVPDDLKGVDRIIVPGGESTTVGMLMQRFGLGPALCSAAEKGMPIWGTCMGMILMAHEVARRPEQYRLDLLDITVERNAFGAQVHSFEDEVAFKGFAEPVTGVFIRSPVVTRHGPQVEVLAEYRGQIVAVRQASRLGTSFHPELTDDLGLHRYFLDL